MATETRITPTPPVGVIESLSQGFETVAGHAALLILPLLLDLLLWAGPRVSFAPVINGFIRDYHETITSVVEKPDPQFESQWQIASGQLSQMLGGSYAQYFPLIGVPSVFAGREASPLPFHYVPPLWIVRSVMSWFGIRFVALLLGLLTGTIYVILIGQQVFDGQIRIGHLLARLPLVAIQIGILSILLVVLLMVIMAPFVLLAIGTTLISPNLAEAVLLIGQLVGLWASMFGIFTIHGMLMNRRNLFGALWDSIRVVQWNMSSTLLLMLAVVLISMAMGFIWSLTNTGSWISILAVAGNAFASTGLVTATFIFYKDRYRYWREMREALLAELQRRRAQNRTQL